ncbi:hypothetical protein [Tamlana crocina]|uniref:Phenylalanyl-tRNA synthetase subunit alpha n=1 Tax=Tamlana crocina TaxID=393006 RepID=A0ABX1D707_9FLAO|nr:hypothetical protein [Tamlana crocina]NJX14147.1 hypothetical protein [Tamlana crocina]
MKTSLIIISALLVLCVFVPFFLFIYNSSKHTSKIKQLVKSFSKSENHNYTAQEFWRKNFIGITENNVLTVAQIKDDVPQIFETNLNEIASCKVIKEYAASKDHKSHLKSLGLELKYKQASLQPLFIQFFDVDLDVTEDFEMQRIEKWHELINQAVAKRELIKKAS